MEKEDGKEKERGWEGERKMVKEVEDDGYLCQKEK